MDKEKVTPLDYSKVENWIINANADLNKTYDLIFFCGTSVVYHTKDNGVGDVSEDMRLMGYENYLLCGSQLTEDARIFCPLQRQMSLDYAIQYQTHETILNDIASKEPYVDLEAALDYYFEHYNKGAKRPFVLAGHSQGAASIQVCISKYFLLTEKRDYLKNMIAAYSLGYGVSKRDFEALPYKEGRIHFAEGPDDFNCLISWNTEGVGKKGRSILLADEGDTTLVINPLNWKRDETYASIDDNAGVFVSEKTPRGTRQRHISLLENNLLDAQIDLKRGSVICSTRKKYVTMPDGSAVWGGKSLHFYDGKGFYNNMKNNLRTRVRNFLAAKDAETKS